MYFVWTELQVLRCKQVLYLSNFIDKLITAVTKSNCWFYIAYNYVLPVHERTSRNTGHYKKGLTKNTQLKEQSKYYEGLTNTQWNIVWYKPAELRRGICQSRRLSLYKGCYNIVGLAVRFLDEIDNFERKIENKFVRFWFFST